MKGIIISTQERNKNSKIQDYPLEDFYYIPVLKTLCKTLNDHVKEGELLTYCDVTNHMYHSPITGTIINILNLNNKEYFEIQRNQNVAPISYSPTPPQSLPADILLDRIKNSGIIQYSQLIKAKNNIKHLIINGLEKDIFITANQQLLEEKIQEIIQTAFQLKQILNAVEIIIVINKNAKLKNHIESFLLDQSITLIEVPKRYPLVEEKLLIHHLFNIELKKSQSTIAQQILTLDVGTMVAIYDALFYQKPFIDKVISVEGAYSLMHGNFRVKIGTPITAFMRPFSAENSYVMFSGGAITGTPLDKEKSFLKQMDAIMIFEGRPQAEQTYCISCELCNHHCPIHLEPIKLVDYIQNKEYQLTQTHHAQECIFCNICTYVCPSFIPLGAIIKSYVLQQNYNGDFDA